MTDGFVTHSITLAWVVIDLFRYGTAVNLFFMFGYPFAKLYKTNPLPNPSTETTVNALSDHWTCRFDCFHSTHTDYGRN